MKQAIIIAIAACLSACGNLNPIGDFEKGEAVTATASKIQNNPCMIRVTLMYSKTFIARIENCEPK